MLFTVVSAVQDGQYTVIGILEGAYGLSGGADMSDAINDGEIFASVIDADTLQDAERIVKERYSPAVSEPGEEPPC